MTTTPRDPLRAGLPAPENTIPTTAFSLPPFFGDLLSATPNVVYFESGYRLQVWHPADPAAPPRPLVELAASTGHGIAGMGPDSDAEWEEISRTWACGSAVFSAIVRDLEAKGEARCPAAALLEADALTGPAAEVGRPSASPPPEAPPVLAAQNADAAGGPLTTWAAVARAVGVSGDTLARRRSEWGITSPKPFFKSIEEAREWYRAGGSGIARHNRPSPSAKARGRMAAIPGATRGTTLADLDAARGKGGRRSR